MKLRLTLLLAFPFFFTLSTISLNAAVDTLTILHVNDTHSCLAPLAPRNPDLSGTQGGIARAASVIGLTKMTEANVLTLHAGDSFIGDMFFNNYYGAAEFQLMNMIGFDAMTVGNHEFDLTPAILDTACHYGLTPAGIPLLSANLVLDDPSVQDLKNFIKPYIIKEYGSMKVGIFGLTTPSTNIFSQPAPAFVDTNIGVIAAMTVQELNAQGCNVIILLSHLGVYYDEMIAAEVPGINIIIGGHDHYLFDPKEVTNPLGQPTWIVQVGSNYSHIGNIKLVLDNGTVSLAGYQAIPLDSTVPEEPTVKAAVDGMIAEIESKYGIPFYTQQIGLATSDFEEVTDIYSQGPHDTPLGNLITDAFRDTTKTDIAVTVGGSIAQKLYHGPITPIDLFRAIGYGFNEVNGLGFRLVTFNITGEQLWTAFESVLSMVEQIDEMVPQVSGMKYHSVITDPPGSRLKWLTVGDQPLDPAKTYSVTVNEFLLFPLQQWFGIQFTDVFLYQDFTEFQALLNYVIKQQVITPSSEGRVTLPVELISFNASVTGNKVNIFWQTATETNNRGFEIQRKTNNYSWQTIGFVNGKGTTTQTQSYSYYDNLEGLVSSGKIFYRLKMINYDGSFEYSTEVIVNLVPNKFELAQNFPNPFNPSTVIRWQSPVSGWQTLKIYDVLGNEVATLVNEEKPAGSYHVEFNADHLASGMYLYKLQAGSFFQTKKMSLLK